MFSFLAVVIIGGGLVWYSTSDGWSDKAKLEKIFMNRGLYIKEGKTIKKMKLYRKTDYSWGTELAYKIPLGLSFPQIEQSIHAIQDGLNNKVNGNQKVIEMDYDGMLRVRVFNKTLPNRVDFERDFIKLSQHIPIGIDAIGNIIQYDFDKSHLLIAGTSGYGKSELAKLIITSLIVKFGDNLQLTLIDLKGGLELNMFSKCKQVVHFAKDEFEAEYALKNVVNDMKAIQNELLEKDLRNANELNKPYHFVFIDEAAELSPTNEVGESKKAKQSCQKYMSEIARLGRTSKFKIVYATQAPYRENLSPQVKQNCDTKITYRLQTQKASEVVIDEGGAEKLPHKLSGRAIFYTDKKQIIQTFYMPYELIQELIEPYKVVVSNDNKHKSTPQAKDRGDIAIIR